MAGWFNRGTSHGAKMVPAFGEEHADGNDDKDEGGEKKEEAEGLADDHGRPPLPLLPPKLGLAPLAQGERASQRFSRPRRRRQRSTVC